MMNIERDEEMNIERDEDGLLWVTDNLGNIVCQAFYKSVDQTSKEMEAEGYTLFPDLFEGEQIYTMKKKKSVFKRRLR